MTRTILLLLMWLSLSAFNYGKELKVICTSAHEQIYDICFKASVIGNKNCEELQDVVYAAEFSDCERNEVFCDMWAKTQALICNKICELQRSGKSYKESKVKIYPFCMALWAYWIPKMSQAN